MNDPRFVAAYARGVSAVGQDYHWHWRVHIGLWAAQTAARLPGDFVECGVNRGFLSSSIMALLEWDRLDKHFYLLDTFRGIDPRVLSDQDLAEGVLEKSADLIDSGFYATDSTTVRKNFSEWRRVSIIEGAVPDTLPLVKAEQVAFLHIDMNCAAPEFFWDRLVTGAPVLLDDHAYAGYRHQKPAMDAVAAARGTTIASLPTGQGLLIKT